MIKKQDINPFFSIIVAVYNGEKTLQDCIDSIKIQSFQDFELIVIDGASKDGTIDVVRKNQRFINKYISEPDSGIYSAWNKAIKIAEGKWICFLGCDDILWDQNVLYRVWEESHVIPIDKRVIYGEMMILSDKGEPLYRVGKDWSLIKDDFLGVMCLPHPGMMHHRDLFDEHGCFNESFKIAGDYEFLLRELKFKSAHFMHGSVNAGMRQGGISSSQSNALKSLHESRLAQKMHGINVPRFIWLCALTRVYIRFIIKSIVGQENSDLFIEWLNKFR